MLNVYLKRAIFFLSRSDGEGQVIKRLVHGVSWSFISSVIIRAIAFITAIVNSHILGKNSYGELGIILNTLVLFGILSSGYGATCSKYIAELKNNSPIKAQKIFTLSTVLSVFITLLCATILFFSASLIANNVLNAPNLITPLKIASIALVAQSIIGISDGVLYGLQAFKIRSNINTVQAFIWLPATVILSKLFSLNGALVAYTFSYIITAIIYVFITSNICKSQNFFPIYKNIWSEWSIVLNYTLPVMFNSLLIIPTNWICSIILVKQTNNFAELGGFNAANQWRILVLQIPFLLQSTVTPVMNECLGNQKTSLFNQLFIVIYKIIFAVSTITSLLGICFSRQLMALFGEEFSSDYKVMMVIMITSLIISMSGFIGNKLLILNKTWMALLVNIFYSIIAIILGLFFTSLYGALGMSISILIAYFSQGIISICLLKKYYKTVKFKLILELFLSGVLVSLTCTSFTYVSQKIGILFTIPAILAIFYFFLKNMYKDLSILKSI